MCATVNNLRARQFEPSSLLSRVHNTFACVALWLEVHIKWVGCMLQHSALQHYSCIELCIYMDFWLQHDLSKILWTTIEAGSGHEVVCVLTWQLLFPSFLSLITERRYICEEGEDEGSWLVEKVHVRVRYDHILWLLVIFSCSQLQNLKQKSQVSFSNECTHFVNLDTINFIHDWMTFDMRWDAGIYMYVYVCMCMPYWIWPNLAIIGYVTWSWWVCASVVVDYPIMVALLGNYAPRHLIVRKGP